MRKHIHAILFWIAVTFADYSIIFNTIFLYLRIEDLWRDTDFNHYYVTAWLVSQGKVPYGISFLTTPYASQFEWNELIPSATNPPLLALLTVPLTFFTPKLAWQLWETMIIFSAAAYFYCLLRMLGQSWSNPAKLLGFLLFFGSWPLVNSLQFSQVQPLLILLASLSWIAIRTSHFAKAGICLAFFINIKFIGWPLVLFLSVKFGWKVLRPFLLTTILLLILQHLVLGLSLYPQFIEQGLPIINTWSSSTLNVSIGGSLMNALDGFWENSQYYDLVKITLAYFLPNFLAIALAIILAKKSASIVQLDCSFSLLTLTSFLITPVAWHSYLIVFFFPLAVYWTYCQRSMPQSLFITLFWFVVLTKPLAAVNYNSPWGKAAIFVTPWVCGVILGWVSLSSIFCTRVAASTKEVAPKV